MTDEQLIAKALELAKQWESAPKASIKVGTLPKIRVRGAAVIYFESDEHSGSIKVVLDKETGDLITANLVPPKTG